MNEMERLQLIMQEEKLSAKDFAAEVGISAATMSNILNMKNKPSLEVMQKVLHRFRMVSSDWLILGVGTMYKLKVDATEQSLFDIKPDLSAVESVDSSNDGQNALISQPQATKQKTAVQIVERTIERKVTRVVVFFDDGTFQELNKI